MSKEMILKFNVSQKLNVSTISVVLTVCLVGMNNLIYAQESNRTFIEDEFGLPNKDTVEKIMQYCRFIHDYGVNDGKEDITGDLVSTGNISTVYKDWTCKDAEKSHEELEKLENGLSDVIELGGLGK